MTDKIKELKALIENLEADSPLRKQLEEALEAELKREAENASKTDAGQTEGDQTDNADKESDDSQSNLDDLKKLNEKLEEMLEQLEKENPSTLTGKLEKLMEDDEFITASAGFVLGAAFAGLSAVAISMLGKK